MDFRLSEEQSMLVEMCRNFANDEIRPKAAEIDETATFPQAIVDRMIELGLMGIAIPDEMGGSGMDSLAYALALEEISAGCASCGVIMSVNNSLVCEPLKKWASEEQIEQFLKPAASGQMLGCFGLSEPGTGSDAANQTTVAKKDGDAYIVNGAKNFITSGQEADFMITFAMEDKSLKHKGISAFIIPKDSEGYSVDRNEKKLGIKGSSTSLISLEDVRVPAAYKLGEFGEGFKIAMHTLDCGRIGIAAQALGIAREAFEKASLYALERSAFNKPIAQHQSIQNYLADMATELEAARLLIYKASCLKDSGARFSKEAAMSKLYASEMATRVTHKAIQIHGGYGFIKEYSPERHYRDARITEIYEGTSEIQRLVIASAVLKEAESLAG